MVRSEKPSSNVSVPVLGRRILHRGDGSLKDGRLLIDWLHERDVADNLIGGTLPEWSNLKNLEIM